MPSSRSSRRLRGAAATAPAFPALAIGIQHGLHRLVLDNTTTVARMLDYEKQTTAASADTNLVDILCEKCAKVMKQQQLSVASFLARFFVQDILSNHLSSVLQKSGKGSTATLGDRIEREWMKDNPLLQKQQQQPPPTKTSATADKVIKKEKSSTKEKEDEENTKTKKRQGEHTVEVETEQHRIPKKKKSSP